MSSEDKPSKETLDEWHKDPANWFLGVFYYNKKDKRIFPPKRLSVLGLTINFANPYSVIIVTLIVITVALIIRALK